jgi:hypothetical protein
MSCASALENFAARDFSKWSGLPQCSLAEVTERFRLLNDGYGFARLGRIKREFRMLVVENYDHPVRVWSDSVSESFYGRSRSDEGIGRAAS